MNGWKKMAKIIVYTVNIGDYDEMHKAPNDSVNYLYFTDGESPKGWKKIPIEGGTRKDSRYWKINSHLLPPHDISIYIDSCFEIKKKLSELAFFLGDYDFAVCEHKYDNCVYNHAKRVVLLNLDHHEIVRKQIKKYKREGLPCNIGLSENGLLIRRNTAQVKRMNELWWKEYQEGSQRDQLSLPYARWKTGIKTAWLPFSLRQNRWLGNWARHKIVNANKIL
jgi:hypothetical protein